MIYKKDNKLDREYHKIDKQYTLEEYQILYGMYKKGFHFAKRLKSLIEGKPIFIRRGEYVRIYKSMSMFLLMVAPKTFEIMYKTPLIYIPTVMNSKSETIQGIIKWRLMIGK